MKSDESKSVGAPIEVLVPRPLQDLSGSIQFQDGWDEAQAVAEGVQPPADEEWFACRSERFPEWLVRGPHGHICTIPWAVQYAERSDAYAQLIEATPRLYAALKGLIESATAEANEKGLGGYHSARLTDAREAIALAETQRSMSADESNEKGKEGLQGPAIEDRARLLDALETIDIIWRHYVKPHTSDWRETEKAIKTVRAALGVEPRPQDRQEGTAGSFSSEPSSGPSGAAAVRR